MSTADTFSPSAGSVLGKAADSATGTDTFPRIAYLFSHEACRATSLLPANKNRVSPFGGKTSELRQLPPSSLASKISLVVHSLIRSLGLTDHMRVVAPIPASSDDLKTFHSSDYVDFLFASDRFLPFPLTSPSALLAPAPPSKKLKRSDAPAVKAPTARERKEFDEACLWTYIQYVAGGSITAAKEIAEGRADVAVWWDGGRHHGGRDQAAGFCYVNDVVLAVSVLNQTFDRVMVVDVDIHHGDATQSAFLHSPSILTVSLHLSHPGFYPTTGTSSHPIRRAINLPLLPGASSSTIVSVWDRCVEKARQEFTPDAVVVVMGADGMRGDGLLCRGAVDTTVLSGKDGIDGAVELDLSGGTFGRGGSSAISWRLGTSCFKDIVERVMSWGVYEGNNVEREGDAVQLQPEHPCCTHRHIPVLFLGGGGYTHANVARANAVATATIISSVAGTGRCGSGNCEAAATTARGVLDSSADVPDHEFWELYAENGWKLHLDDGVGFDENTSVRQTVDHEVTGFGGDVESQGQRRRESYLDQMWPRWEKEIDEMRRRDVAWEKGVEHN
ncbi:hypothetical protein HDU93_002331 [Gonapodya sp. JEL0774]|nr:hypothetical protein HDU93_002331 [Gonapodya sp. JEL0774]